MRPGVVPTAKREGPLGFATFLALMDKRSGNWCRHVSTAKSHMTQSGCAVVAAKAVEGMRSAAIALHDSFSKQVVSKKGGDQRVAAVKFCGDITKKCRPCHPIDFSPEGCVGL